jgi:predicted translation initiation factor SUI1
MADKKYFRTLSDLEQLLPDSYPKTSTQSTHDGKGKIVHVTLDFKGRKGKTVTLISGLQHNPQTIEEIAKILKQHCGAGGTVKERTIEIQGDQRKRVTEKLVAMNYSVT